MATAEANEEEFARILNKTIRNIRKDNNNDITLIIQSSNKQTLTVPQITEVKRVGGRGQKADLYIKSKSLQNNLTVSVKDNRSNYWDSGDVYIRNMYGKKIRERLLQLSMPGNSADKQNSQLIVKFASNIAERFTKKTSRGVVWKADVDLQQPIGFFISPTQMQRAVFGTTSNVIPANNIAYAQCVIRHEIFERDVVVSFDDKTNTNIITLTVGKLYRNINSIPSDERPVVYIYSDRRNTFKLDKEDDTQLNISGFYGVRGAIRTRSDVQEKTNGVIYNDLISIR